MIGHSVVGTVGAIRVWRASLIGLSAVGAVGVGRVSLIGLSVIC